MTRKRSVSVIFVGLFILCFVSSCGLYFKTYRFKSDEPFAAGLSEQDVMGQWGSPLSVQIVGPMQVWRYFAQEPAYGKKNEYYLVWFQNGQVVKWNKTEEETVPPQPVP